MPLRSQTQRTLLFLFIASIGLCGLVGIYCLVVGSFGDLVMRILGTNVAVGTASILAMLSAIPWERKRWSPVGPCGVIAVVIALVLVLTAIWMDFYWYGGFAWFYKSMVIAVTLAGALPHIGLLSLARLRRRYEPVRVATVAVIAVGASQVIGAIIAEIESDWWYRMVGVIAILNVCGTIAVPVLHRVSAIPSGDPVPTMPATVRISLTCPRCEQCQSVSVGRSQCEACGLRFSFEIDEEHCPKCGYVLYRHGGGVCPECGTAVASHTV